MKKVIVILFIVILIVIGVFVIKKNKKYVNLGDKIQPEIGSISLDFRVTGEVKPRNRLEIKSQVAGRIEDILVVEGDKIKKGKIMAWMSSTDRASLLDAARAKGDDELKKWEDIYKPTPIIAPIDGFIIVRNKEPGQTISMADVMLVMADELIVEANVDETDLGNIRLDQQVKMFLDAYPGKKFGGIVEHIAYESVPVGNVTIYKVKISPLQMQRQMRGIFRSGMTATIEVSAQKKENILLLPIDAITDKDNKKFVMVNRIMKSEQMRTELCEVQVGINNGKKIEIVSGITKDDIIILPPLLGKSRQFVPRGMGIPGIQRRR